MTTNGPESFHSHYNSQFYTPHPNIFQVIDVLKDFQVQTMLKISSISNNKIMFKEMIHLKNTTYYMHDGHNIKMVRYLN